MNMITEFITFVLLSLTVLISTRPKRLFDSITFEKAYIIHAILGVLSFFSLNLYIAQLSHSFLKQNIWLSLGMIVTLFSGAFGLTSFILKFFPKIRQFRDKYLKRSIALWVHRLSLIIYLIIFITIIKNSLDQQHYAQIFMYSLLAFFVLARFFYYQVNIKHSITYRVQSNQAIAHRTHKIILEPVSKTLPMSYNQFVFIQSKNDSILKESHPFSVVNNRSRHIELLIKQVGDETNRINQLTHQSLVYIEGSYPNLSKQLSRKNDLLLIAGGIGISTFIGQLENLILQGNRNIHIIWSVSSENELFNLSQLEELKNVYKQFSYSLYVTSDPTSKYNRDRLDYDSLKKELVHLNKQTMGVIISTNYHFSRLLHKELLRLGVKKNQIHHNDFLF